MGHRLKSLRAILGIAAAISVAFPGFAESVSDPVCKSASLWEVPGPRDEIQIGDRKLSIPTALDAYTIDGGMLGFIFHIKPDGNLELDEDHDLDKGCEHGLSFYILDEDSVADTTRTKLMLRIMGYPGIPEKNPDVKGFDAYKGQTYDIYVAKSRSYYLALACINKFPGYSGPWTVLMHVV